MSDADKPGNTSQPARDPMDPRADATRRALLDAFFELVLSRPYDQIQVTDITRLADVGRSTFYEHFSSKDDLLSASLHGVLRILAGAVFPGEVEPIRVLGVVQHFWENRTRARMMLDGKASVHVIDVLARHILQRMQERDMTSPIPLELAASQAAESQIGLIRAWLREQNGCSAEQITQALLATRPVSH